MADDESVWVCVCVCVCVKILLTYSSHGKSNAIDSLSQESDQTVYQAGWIKSGEGWGSEELNILHHTLHGVDPESHAQSMVLNPLT